MSMSELEFLSGSASVALSELKSVSELQLVSDDLMPVELDDERLLHREVVLQIQQIQSCTWVFTTFTPTRHLPSQWLLRV